MTPSPSAPALRAAQHFYRGSSFDIRALDLIIIEAARDFDEVTGLPELIAALRALRYAEWMVSASWTSQEKRDSVLAVVDAALSRVEQAKDLSAR